MSTPIVYTAIAAVMAALAREGIAKGGRNQQQGYNFRGIDQVYNALAPVLSEHKLIMLPRVLAREQIERQTKSGGALFYVTVDVEFDLVSAEDGSKHTIRTCGEAMDSADKATNKAMSAAYKYAAMQAFCIPTEGDNDADATSHDVAPAPRKDLGPAPVEGKDFWDCEGAGMSAHAAKAQGLGDVHDSLLGQIDTLPTTKALWAWCKSQQPDIAPMPRSWRSMLRDKVEERLAELGASSNERAA